MGSPLIQTLLARIATSYLSKELNTEIRVDKLEIAGLRSIKFTNILVRDLNNDTLASVGYLGISYAGRILQVDIRKLGNLTIKDAVIRINKSEGSDDSNIQFLLDYFSWDQDKQPPDEILAGDKNKGISVDKITVINTSFNFENKNEERIEMGVDFNDLGIQLFNLNARNMAFEKDTFSVRIDHLSVAEKSGFIVDSFSCDFKLSPILLQARNLLVRTPLNDLDLDFSFSYSSMPDFNDFINKVDITANIRPSLVNLSEVGYFAPVMFNMYNNLNLSADIRGTVSNFKAKDLNVSIGRSTRFIGNVQMNGLPDIRETFIHVTANQFVATLEDAREFRLPTEEIYITLPDILSEFGIIHTQGKFTGFFNDFVTYASFQTGAGNFETDILLRVNRQNNIEYSGNLAAEEFNIGRFLHSEQIIGHLNLTAAINGSGTTFGTMKLKMDGEINSLELLNNLYNEIKISGSLENKKFAGELNVRDENIALDFNGSLDYSNAIPAYDFKATIRDAYLSRINLVDRDSSAKLSAILNINFMGDKIDNTQGIIIIDSTIYQENGKEFKMNDFTLSVTRDSTKYVFLRLYSDVLDATMEGQYTLYLLPLSLKNLFNAYLDTLITDKSLENYTFRNQDFVFSVNLKNTRALTELFYPDLEIKQNARFSGGYNERIGNLFFDANCAEFIFQGIQFDNWYAEYFIKDSTMKLITGAERVFYSDTLKSDSLLVHINARNDSLGYRIKWKDFGEIPFSKADFSGNFIFKGRNSYDFNFGRSSFEIANNLWTINPKNHILIDSNMILIQNMELVTSNQMISIHGMISPNPTDTLLIDFRNLNLSNFDLLLQSKNIDIDGTLNGNIRFFDYYNSPFYLSDLHVNDFSFNKEKLGELDISSTWYPEMKAFGLHGSIIYTGNIGKDTTLFISGKYYPERLKDNFDITVDLNKYKLNTLVPFTRSFSSDIHGMATGKVLLRGSKSKPEITGEVNLIRAAMLIDYLNVTYFFADQLKFDMNRFYFENLVVNDSLNNQGIANGSIYHDHLTNFSIDLNIATTNLVAMNTSRSQNEAFYGKILGGGNFRIHGPFDNLNMEITARSEKGTSIKIPVSYGTDVGTSDYIVFAGTEDDFEKEDENYTVDMRGLNLILDLDVTNDADIQMFMPNNMGTLRAKGKGDIKMTIDPAGNLGMEGEYVIDRGSFFFTLGSILNRTFEISRGSRVTWTGDPYNAQINMKAVYKVKTTLGEYGPPEDSATRVPVNCIIKLTNNLINPEISFSIEFPDLKEDVKQTIYSRLDTTDQAEMSRQMISLLVMNNFYQPSGFSGSVGFNTFDLVTNQLNNWLSQISNDFDIGVKYRPGDDISSREVEVALSTQLFDERVLIDGNLGMRENSATSQNTNNIVGEVTVEVKITTDGRFRAKAFNKSNNNYLYKNYAPYTQGVGLFYTQEFNRMSELFMRRKHKEKDKDHEEAEEEEHSTDDDTVKN